MGARLRGHDAENPYFLSIARDWHGCPTRDFSSVRTSGGSPAHERLRWRENGAHRSVHGSVFPRPRVAFVYKARSAQRGELSLLCPRPGWTTSRLRPL